MSEHDITRQLRQRQTTLSLFLKLRWAVKNEEREQVKKCEVRAGYATMSYAAACYWQGISVAIDSIDYTIDAKRNKCSNSYVCYLSQVLKT